MAVNLGYIYPNQAIFCWMEPSWRITREIVAKPLYIAKTKSCQIHVYTAGVCDLHVIATREIVLPTLTRENHLKYMYSMTITSYHCIPVHVSIPPWGFDSSSPSPSSISSPCTIHLFYLQSGSGSGSDSIYYTTITRRNRGAGCMDGWIELMGR